MLSQQGPTAERDAEDYYFRSLEVAREQKCLSWELRTSVSLTRLWREVGKREQAAKLLFPIVSRFTEGFLTPDVKEAMEFMNELRQEPSGGRHQ
jgi:hypothetical protein